MLKKFVVGQHRSLPGRQKGMTLMELLVAGFISIIASSGMVMLMASTLSTGTQTIKWNQLSQQVRTAMQIMTRELRRANYHSTYAVCFGNPDCRADLAVSGKVKEINIVNIDDNKSCFWFWYDRPQDASETQLDVNLEQVAAFRSREVTNRNGAVVGVIEMAIGVNTAPACIGEADSWTPITDREMYDVTFFRVDDHSFSTELTTGTSLVTDMALIQIQGQLVEKNIAWMTGPAPSFYLRDIIRVRNDIPTLTPPP